MLSWGVRRGKLRFKRALHRTWVTPAAVSTFLTSEQGHQHAVWNTLTAPEPVAERPSATGAPAA